MNKTTRYSPEFRERAVWIVFEHQAEYDSQWAAMGSIAVKIGCAAETLRKWGRQENHARCFAATDERVYTLISV